MPNPSKSKIASPEILSAKLKEKGLKYQIDELYTVLSQDYYVWSNVWDALKQEEFEEFEIDPANELHQIFQKAYDLSNAPLNDRPMRNYDFQWNHREGGFFKMPHYFSDDEIKDSKESLLRIIAVNIASEVNKCGDSFEKYQDHYERFPESNDYRFDRHLFAALRHVYTKRQDKSGLFYNLLKTYLLTDFGIQWLENFALRLFSSVEDCITGKDLEQALALWKVRYSHRYSDFPVGVFMPRKSLKNIYNVQLQSELNTLNADLEKYQFQGAASREFIQNWCEDLKKGIHGVFSNGYDSEYHRKVLDENWPQTLELPFEDIISKAKQKSRVLFLAYLEAIKESGLGIRPSKFNSQQLATLAHVLKECGGFGSIRQARIFLIENFKGINQVTQKTAEFSLSTLEKAEIPKFVKDFSEKLRNV